MISAIFLVNQKGEVVMNRLYRDDVARTVVDTFRMKVCELFYKMLAGVLFWLALI